MLDRNRLIVVFRSVAAEKHIDSLQGRRSGAGGKRLLEHAVELGIHIALLGKLQV